MTDTAEAAALVGRTDVNDLDEILSVEPTSPDEVIHSVTDHAERIYTWDYTKGARPQLSKLYEKAKRGQWNGETDLPWDTLVDPEAEATTAFEVSGGQDTIFDFSGTAVASWGRDEWIRFNQESQAWTMSQFLHGEQGALICTAKIVETVPWIDAKYYASTQVVDEARHVEVFAKYLDAKLDNGYPINPHLKMLLDDIVSDSRWDMTYLGMQIMVEGLALAAFGFMYQGTDEPLLKQLLRYVMSDEARHVAFGVLTLREVYVDMDAAEIRERQEFAFEAALRMRDRFLSADVWDRLGVDARTVIPRIWGNPDQQEFQHLLFTKIVPNCKKLGLLDAGDAWLRRRFEDIGVIQYEDWTDTATEVDTFALTRELTDDVEGAAPAAGAPRA